MMAENRLLAERMRRAHEVRDTAGDAVSARPLDEARRRTWFAYPRRGA
jgi:hypothetical protein